MDELEREIQATKVSKSHTKSIPQKKLIAAEAEIVKKYEKKESPHCESFFRKQRVEVNKIKVYRLKKISSTRSCNFGTIYQN